MLTPFFQHDENYVVISREQGSAFAKQIADDFNPLHDIDAKKFCVPGDLLFSLVLEHYGVSQSMTFSFAGMVDETSRLEFPEASSEIKIVSGEKTMLVVEREGESSLCKTLVETLIRNYVAFSGTTFPHVIIPLMAEQDVMINPARPMVIYESMSISLEKLDIKTVDLEPGKHEFSFDGKRGKIVLRFDLVSDGVVVGHGEKHMLVSGIKSYCEQEVASLIEYYNNRKTTLR
ncbi:DUF3581 domain-containing protein [Pseudoalteromonas xiamenensis]|uniref:DUF3581 family protein n=1 Tax=Pseudoalteromonas xiamenensis TaxID=882626 RepID=UPI0027E3DF94|nr:DUF3581 family protein [Pseudoalteromonas xiamenensis]WMN61021.1 DUF3581 domain-containing protein [Pseudoalteromonas xiamenensis]